MKSCRPGYGFRAAADAKLLVVGSRGLGGSANTCWDRSVTAHSEHPAPLSRSSAGQLGVEAQVVGE
jgi:hypothetical protein